VNSTSADGISVIVSGSVLASGIRRYKVKGTNPETGKRKTEQMLIGSWEYMDKVIPSRTYLTPPYEVSDCTALPTEAQFEVFRKNGIAIRPGMSRRDASAVIGHIINDTTYRDENEQDEYGGFSKLEPYQKTLSRDFLQFAVDHQVELSWYYTPKEARNILKMNIKGHAKEINALK